MGKTSQVDHVIGYYLKLFCLPLASFLFIACASSVSSTKSQDTQSTSPAKEPRPVSYTRTAFKLHPDYTPDTYRITNLTILPIDIEVVHMTAGGGETREDWAATAQKNMMKPLLIELPQRFGVKVQYISEESLAPQLQENLRETEALFSAVNTAILHHSFGHPPALFPEKAEIFDYSVGQEISELAPEADAFLVIKGIDRISSGGRETMDTTMAIVGLLVGVVPIPQEDFASGTMALIGAKDGKVLAYKFLKCGHCEDLREAEQATKLANELFWNLPVRPQ